MATTIRFRPVSDAGTAMSDDFKRAVAQRWFGQDGSQPSQPKTVTGADREFLLGIRALAMATGNEAVAADVDSLQQAAQTGKVQVVIE